MSLTYETPYLFEPEVAGGLTRSEVDTNAYRLQAARSALFSARDAHSLPFAELPYEEEMLLQIEQMAKSFTGYKQVVVIGIGGSDLGARAAFEALCHPAWNLEQALRGEKPQLFFAGDSTDSDALASLIDILRFDSTILVMISKSGKTIEQMSNFLILRQKLVDSVGLEQSNRQIVTITDPTSGTLRELTNAHGWASLPHHAAGGRFAVLSTVGLFPLALIGLDIHELVAGARELDKADRVGGLEAISDYAYHHILAFEQGYTQHILFAYKNNLSEFGRWYRQLWAESLGKKVNRKGEEIFTGPTPGMCIGPRDQHSQAQLYIEGPKDKLFTFLTVSEPNRDLTIPNDLPENEFIQQLKGLSLNRILTAEYEGTAGALAEAGRPSVHIALSKLDERHLGALFYFFELATAYAGELLDIDAYNQPGVERGKVLMYEHLQD